MIKTIKHKGLRLLFEKDDASKLSASQVERIRDILSALDAAAIKEDMNYPASGFHELKGRFKRFLFCEGYRKLSGYIPF